MKLLSSTVAILATSSVALSAATVVYDVERWETDGNYGIWENATNQYRSNGAGAGNVLWDQQPGSDIALSGFPASADAIRIRSSTGSMVLADPIPLLTLGATSVTFQYDLRENVAGYLSLVQYSSDGEFQFDGDGDDTVTLASYDGNGTIDGPGIGNGWNRYSHTITSGLTDTFQFRLGKPGRGTGANNTHHAWDNFVITYETADAVIPEPSSTALFGLGGIALLLRRRK